MASKCDATNAHDLELHVYNTAKAAERELMILNAGLVPDSLLQALIRTLEKCHQLDYFVGTAVYTPTTGHVYLSSEDNEWVGKITTDESRPPTGSVHRNVLSGEPFYPEGRFIDLSVYNITERDTYRSRVSRENSTAHARLLWRFLKALKYFNENPFTIQNAVYTDDDSFINITTSTGTGVWTQNLDKVLQDLP